MIDVNVAVQAPELVANQLRKAVIDYRCNLSLLVKEGAAWYGMTEKYQAKLVKKWRKTISILEKAVARMDKVNSRD